MSIRFSKIVNIFLNESFCNSFRPLITQFLFLFFQPILPFYSNIKSDSERKWGGISSFLPLPLLFLVVYQQELSQEFVWTILENWTNPQLGQKKKKRIFLLFIFFCDCNLSDVNYWREWSVAASFSSKIVMRGGYYTLTMS